MMKSKITFILVILFFLLTLFFFQKEVKNSFYLISSPVQKILWQAGDNFADFLESITKTGDLQKENENLTLKIQELLSKNIFLKEIEKENVILREALDVGLEKSFQLEMVQVFSKDISQDSVLINRGKNDGILKGFPVINQQKALIGRIEEVYNNFSKVNLISHPESNFSVEISEREIEGIAKGQGGFGLELDLVPREKEIQEGDIVITSHLGGVFPKGLLTGEITKISKSDPEPFQKADIKLSFELENLDILFVITDF